MKAEIWQLTVYDGVLGWNHRCGSKINEIFIPQLNVFFNLYLGTINCWKEADSNRYHPTKVPDELKRDAPEDCPPEKVADIEIPDPICDMIQRYIAVKEEIKSLEQWFGDVTKNSPILKENSILLNTLKNLKKDADNG